MSRTATLRELLAPVRWRLVGSLALAAAAVVSVLLGPASDVATVAILCGLTLAGGLGQFWLRSASISVSHIAAFELEVLLRSPLTDHLARVGLGAMATGKTIITLLLTRYADPQAGAVRIGGVDVRDVDPAELPRG